MTAVLERKTSFRPTLTPVQDKETLTYEILQQHKHKQQSLINSGIIEKPKIVWGFTPEERVEFEKGRSVNEVFDDIAKKYGF